MSGSEEDRCGAGVNAALFSRPSDAAFSQESLARWLHEPGCYLMTRDVQLLPMIAPRHRLPYAGSLLETPEAAADAVLRDLAAQFAALGDVACLIVDMGWALNAVWGASTVERWGGIGVIVESVPKRTLSRVEEVCARIS